MRYEVLLTEGAEHDMEAIYRYILEHDSPASADYVLDRLTPVAEQLASFPDRGPYPPELLALGIHQYRQAIVKPYRVIYQVRSDRVYVHLIADGRRDLQTLLSRRLLSMP
jgi:toxin ParE1/3/4